MKNNKINIICSFLNINDRTDYLVQSERLENEIKGPEFNTATYPIIINSNNNNNSDHEPIGDEFNTVVVPNDENSNNNNKIKNTDSEIVNSNNNQINYGNYENYENYENGNCKNFTKLMIFVFNNIYNKLKYIKIYKITKQRLRNQHQME